MTHLDSNRRSLWESIAPLLDEAMGHLSQTDEDAVLLRLFEHRSLREVGRVLGMRAEAANELVTHALEKLRDCLVRKGVTVSTAVLASALAANAIQEAPVGGSKYCRSSTGGSVGCKRPSCKPPPSGKSRCAGDARP